MNSLDTDDDSEDSEDSADSDENDENEDPEEYNLHLHLSLRRQRGRTENAE